MISVTLLMLAVSDMLFTPFWSKLGKVPTRPSLLVSVLTFNDGQHLTTSHPSQGATHDHAGHHTQISATGLADPVIVTVVTGLIAIVLVAMNGLYWMCAAIAVLEAISITMMIRASRARCQEQRLTPGPAWP